MLWLNTRCAPTRQTHTLTPVAGELEMLRNATFKWIRTDFPWGCDTALGPLRARVRRTLASMFGLTLAGALPRLVLCVVRCSSPSRRTGEPARGVYNFSSFGRYFEEVAKYNISLSASP